MAETSKVKQYFKKCFEPKLLIQKAIIAGAALVIVLSICLPFYLWLKDVPEGTDIGTNSFCYISILYNPNIGFSVFIPTPGIYAVQSIMFILLLAIFLLVTHDKITSSFIALAMFGGLFNLFQRAGCPSYMFVDGRPAVLDYLHFGFAPFSNWFGIFNFPDLSVVIGIVGFVISYITLTIIEVVRENKKPKQKLKEEPKHETR